jgi:MFS family permease
MTSGVVSGLGISAISLGAFVGPTLGGVLLDNYGFSVSSGFPLLAELIIVRNNNTVSSVERNYLVCLHFEILLGFFYKKVFAVVIFLLMQSKLIGQERAGIRDDSDSEAKPLVVKPSTSSWSRKKDSEGKPSTSGGYGTAAGESQA